MQRRDFYGQTVQIGGASPQETEILAFGLCNARLSKAKDPRERIEALNKTHQLWSLLVRDLITVGNHLPEDIKAQLIDLGTWAMRYSILATIQDLPVQPLIDVNRNVADGLRAQVKATALATPTPQAAEAITASA
jgi:flagellar protein FlaF